MPENVFRLPRNALGAFSKAFNRSGADEESINEKLERIERIKAAQTRRDAGAARANIGDGAVTHLPDENEQTAAKATIFAKLRTLPTIGIPFRIIHEHLERKRQQQKLEHEKEARRVWDMLQILEPGTRVKLKGLKSKYGGIDYNNKLATVQAGVGNRFSVKLDLVEKDGAIREGQGAELKIGLQNMTVWDAEIEAVLAAEESKAKELARKERDQAVKDLLALRFRKFLPVKEAADIDRSTSQNEEYAPSVEHLRIEFSDLSPESSVASLRLFHRQEKLRCVLGKWDNSPEIFEKIDEELKERHDAVRKADRHLKDAEAAIRVGSSHPAVRNEYRAWIINASFAIALQALTEGRKRLLYHFAHEVLQGYVHAYHDVEAHRQLSFDSRVAAERGGPSDIDNAYIGHTLLITNGVGQGQDTVICEYDGSTKTAHLSEWNIAIPDSASSYEIFGSSWQPLHCRGRCRGCADDEFLMASDADPQDGFYTGLTLRIVNGPGKHQVASVIRYDGQRKGATISKWRYDKSLFQRVLDQDDEDIPTIIPTPESTYEVQQLDLSSNRSISFHVKGKVLEGTVNSLHLSKKASESDVYTGKGIMITSGSGWGQKAIITAYLGAKRMVSIESWQLTTPDRGSKFSVLKMPKDQEIFNLYRLLQVEQQTAAHKVAALEAARKMKVRAKFRAAARIALWTERSGESILEKRRTENAKSWEYYEQEPSSGADSANIIYVNGKPVKLTWSSIILDSAPMGSIGFSAGNLVTSGDETKLAETVKWNGFIFEAPVYSKLQKNRDGSVEQPIQLVDVSSGRVAYLGCTYDWKTWKSLLEESSPVNGRNDVFEWRGRTVLQPVTSLGDEGEDIFTIVDENGILLYCGPHLEPDETETTFETAGPVEVEDRLSLDDSSKDSSFLLALNESLARRSSEELEDTEKRIQKARDRSAAMGSGEYVTAEEGTGTVHAVGGQIWESADDPMLWKALLEESSTISGRPDAFMWRDLIILQPTREGEYQRVMTENGELIFLGINPNEAEDFPGFKSTQTDPQKHTKIQIQRGTVPSKFGIYEGSHSDGRFEGEGTFQWRNGQVYSGYWRSNRQDGVGTEIFPCYDNVRKDADNEIMFPYYEGRFKKGKRSGKGVYNFASGAKYKGEFSEGLFDGGGILSFTDGTYIDCKWRSGLPLSSTLQYSYRRKQKMAEKVKQSKRSRNLKNF